jgi:hypothetical protein
MERKLPRNIKNFINKALQFGEMDKNIQKAEFRNLKFEKCSLNDILFHHMPSFSHSEARIRE